MSIQSIKVDAIQDPAIREAIQILKDDLLKFEILRSELRHFVKTFTGAATNLRVKHHLGFTPRDIIVTSLTGAGAVTFNYTDFTDEFLDVTVTGPCTVRFFAGNYREG